MRSRVAGQFGRVLAALLWVTVAQLPAPSHALADKPAPTGTFTEAIIETTFSDTTAASHTISLASLAQAGTEIHDWFAMLSYGKLDFRVKTARVTLSNTRAYYQGHCEIDTTPTVLDRCQDFTKAAVDAVKATNSTFFNDVQGVSMLVPEIAGANGQFSWYPIDVGVGHNLQRSYLKEETSSSAANALGPSMVEWGAWAHEFGHQLQYQAGLDMGGWLGHPSGYSSGYDLMDSCYPCHEAPYGLLGSPYVNDNKGSFERWLDTDHVAQVPIPTGGPFADTVTISPLEQNLTTPVKQAIYVPIDSQRYYMVDVRTRMRTDHVGTTNRLNDEGVQIEYVDESASTPMTPCAPPATGGCVKDPVGGTWPYNLWHPGQTFTDTARNIAIQVVAAVGPPGDPTRGYTVTVNRGNPPGHPHLYVIPWLTAPANTYETVDIWVDSSCNGYEVNGFPLRYGRRAGGTVIGSGDDPCLNHENRIYATVHNIGDAASSPTSVQFQVSNPLGVGVTGSWTSLGSVSLPAIAAGGTATVFVPWTPSVTLTPAQIASGHFEFHSCIQVHVGFSSGEIVTSGHDAQENIDIFEARVDPPPSPNAGRLVHVPSMIHNFTLTNPGSRKDLFYENDPHRLYTFSVQSKLPKGWRYQIAGGARQVFLGPGATKTIPVKLIATTGRAGATYNLRVAGITYRWLYNRAVPATNAHYRHFAVGPQNGLTLEEHVVYKSTLTLAVVKHTAAVLEVKGQLVKPRKSTAIAIDYTSPSGAVITHLVKSDAAGIYHDGFKLGQQRRGTWQIRALWQGDTLWSSAVSNTVSTPTG